VVWTAFATFAVVLAGVAAFTAAIHATSQMEFCVSCHSMQSTVFQEYQKSPHFRNASGVRAVCADCHVPRAPGPLLLAKVMAARDLWGELTGVIATPEKFEAHRLAMAKDVWAAMGASDSRECRNCHSFDAMDFHKQREKAAKQMEPAALKNETCIDCHKGIAHKLPDMSTGYKAAFSDLTVAAAAEAARPDTLYTLATTPIYLDRPTGADAPAAGRVLALSKLQVLERAGDFVRVRLTGWQQDGVARMLYAARGQRIFVAALTQAAGETVQTDGTEVDADTGLSWHKATLTGWIARAGLYSDLGRIDAYGDEMYSATCGTCHSLTDPAHFTANQWMGTIDSMKDSTPLDEEQLRFLQKYLQLHAKDAHP
jgi:trimethylamine-N-oxide reductase cytochrome c-type subunit TorC